MILVGVVFCVAIVSYQYFHSVQVKYLSVTTFKACVEAGFKVTTSYPEKCVMPGKSFTNLLQNKASSTILAPGEVSLGMDFKNLTYTINNEPVMFINGKHITTPNQTFSQPIVTFEVTDKQLLHDINNDTKDDVVLLLKMSKSTSKQDVYYITSAIGLNNGYSGTNALFLDYNLKSSAFVYKNGEIVLGYTTSDATSTLIEKHFTFTDNTLKQITYK
jgi:hypothetical protein